MQADLGKRVSTLKQTIASHDGANVANVAFRREVDELIGAFYDDIGQITTAPLRTIFDLFLIKTLYIQRSSRDAAVLEYLSTLLARHLDAGELFPIADDRRRLLLSVADLASEMREPQRFQNTFEVFRLFADNALFIAGVFPRSVRRTQGRRRARTDFVDTEYYRRWGKVYYQRAAEEALAEATNLRETLLKLSQFFEVYMEALNEASETYIMGLDMKIVADKMLDAFNRYRETGDDAYMENARKYASLLKVDSEKFPALFQEKVELLSEPRV